jgi:uncharacterized protein
MRSIEKILVSTVLAAGMTSSAYSDNFINIFKEMLLQDNRASIRRDGLLTEKLAEYAEIRAKHRTIYDSKYMDISYPRGDVPKSIGVCTDLIIRSSRDVGIDLQKLVYNDMQRNFSAYPKKWGLSEPDNNIDHRRVPNLLKYFQRREISVPITKNPKDYLPGDIIFWSIPPRQHVGIVVKKKKDGVPMVAHHYPTYPKIDNSLFKRKIIGHYRYKR